MIPLTLAAQATATAESLIESGAENAAGLWLGVVLGLAGGIALAVVVLALRRPRPDAPQIDQLRLALLEHIAVIDQQYAAGELDETSYQQLWTALQAQLDDLEGES